MKEFLEYNPENLSGGEKQRVAIAGILAYDPDIIIFDESTSMLDPKGVREVNEVINQLKGKKTIILITHNLNEAINSDRVIVMNEGRIVLNDKPEKVFREKDVLKESRLDILESMKIIELIEQTPNLKNKHELEEFLWKLTFQK
jgi:energy-coupling factor transport system ATP-binding protein